MAENKKILDINEDLYELLGVDPEAETIDIKKKYRDLARQMHPDKNRNAQNSADLFIKINHAHLYLINPTTRLIYNAFGLSGLEVYEQSIEDFEKVEKKHQEQEGEGDEENKQETEQKILTKTIHLISETTRRHLIQEYDISSSLEVGID